MSKQPEALRLADDLDAYHKRSEDKEAAAELRRLHKVNAELLFALKNLLDAKNGLCAVYNSDVIARAAIAKAEGGAA
jgi:hypothetical protein